jgi:hypothetical protein
VCVLVSRRIAAAALAVCRARDDLALDRLTTLNRRAAAKVAYTQRF